MTVRVNAKLERFDISSACAGLGLPADTPKGGVIRAALAHLAGKSQNEIASYANPRGENRLTVTTPQVVAELPDDLAEITVATAKNKSEVVRTALLMAAGYDREQAEAMATMQRGRPRKNVVS